MNVYRILCVLLVFLSLNISTGLIHAEEDKSIYKQRMELYKKTEALTLIPWYYFAAIDQYERNTQKNIPSDRIISISIDPVRWYGMGNTSNKNVNMITVFNGIGMDGNGDNKADPENPEDVLFTMGNFLQQYGYSKSDIKIGLWNLYKRDLNVKSIMNNARVFNKFNDIQLTDRVFPMPSNYNYSYNNTWGNRRGFGGLRIHEGTDIFADYGTPVRSTTYGVIELMGWNLFGGWRIGLRDVHNIYHYYAHLSNYKDDIKVGQIVKPGDVIGYVGSTGYGPPGTSGKFPPHLHYGMYKDNGYSEWSFDPYPYLKKWQRMDKK
ncbi:M23 family metallopeptidase [Virgibacillus flavescens]|uniref:M23 family metallopeptidase n=1 Tax=Virgibacillus flavescens TaxID=1611422 RepID=UPI003D330A1F